MLSPLEFTLLRVLEAYSEVKLTGRRIAQGVRLLSKSQISYGSLYTTLTRLDQRGLLLKKKPGGFDSRVNIYTLTKNGAKAIRDTRKEYRRLIEL